MKHGISGYLVMLSHTMDDLPIALFSDRAEAVAFAKQVDPMPTDDIRSVYNTDCSTPVCVSVQEFRGGKPVGATYTRCLDEQDT